MPGVPPVAEPPYTIEVRDASRQRVGLIDRLTTMELTPQFNGVGGWSLTLPYGTAQAAAIVKGGWVSFFSADGREIVTGHVRGLKRTRSEQDAGAGTLQAYGPTAEVVLTDRLAFPVPGQPATTQSGSEYDRRSGVGETVIKQYVNLNAGPGAIVARRTAGLVIETDAGRGATVLGSARMTPLLDLIGPLAQSAGLGFRVGFNGSNLECQIYVPADLSGTARFGWELGNLVSYEQTDEASKANVAIVGGSGDGTARVFREIADSTAVAGWGGTRTEVFVDRRDTSDTTELDQAGTEETVTNGPVSGIDIQTMDIPNLRFGRDYYLGDRVDVDDISDVLRSVTITWDATDGATTKSTVGTASATGTPRMITRLADLNAKVAALQAKK